MISALWTVTGIAVLCLARLWLHPNFLAGGQGSRKKRAHPKETAPEMPLDDILSRLPWGQAAFNLPERMGYGETKTVQLLVDAAKSAEELEKLIAQEEGTGSEHIRLSTRMEARLTGQGFDIGPVTPEMQPVSLRETTEWKWDVRAKRMGSQRLHLSLNAVVKVGGADAPRTIRTFDRNVTVHITGWGGGFQWLQENWVLVTGIGGAIAAVVGWLLKLSPKK